MSRFRARKENLTLHYGVDHAIGYWYDITDNNAINEDGEPTVIEEKSTLFNKLTQSELWKVLKRFNVEGRGEEANW